MNVSLCLQEADIPGGQEDTHKEHQFSLKGEDGDNLGQGFPFSEQVSLVQDGVSSYRAGGE